MLKITLKELKDNWNSLTKFDAFILENGDRIRVSSGSIMLVEKLESTDWEGEFIASSTDQVLSPDRIVFAVQKFETTQLFDSCPVQGKTPKREINPDNGEVLGFWVKLHPSALNALETIRKAA